MMSLVQHVLMGVQGGKQHEITICHFEFSYKTKKGNESVARSIFSTCIVSWFHYCTRGCSPQCALVNVKFTIIHSQTCTCDATNKPLQHKPQRFQWSTILQIQVPVQRRSKIPNVSGYDRFTSVAESSLTTHLFHRSHLVRSRSRRCFPLTVKKVLCHSGQKETRCCSCACWLTG